MLTIWCNTQFTGEALEMLTEGISPHRLVFSSLPVASNISAAEPDPALNSAHIAFGQPEPQSALHSERLRWVHLTSAGYSRYDNEAFRDAATASGLIVTNSSQVYAEPCAEHVLAFLLAHMRRLPQAFEDQRGARSWPALALRAQSRLLKNQNIVLLGFGAIGRRLTELLSPFGTKIVALRRHPTGHESVLAIHETHLEEALASADCVINLLPENAATRGFVSAKLFAAMKAGALFCNIGRGTTVDQDALLASLHSGHLAGAFLDVTDPEPLPAGHGLWTAPNCVITPHTAGGHDTEAVSLVQHFLTNFNEYIADGPLHDRIM